jgi:hypothetical protein
LPRSRAAFALALSLAIAAPAAGEVTRRAASDFHRRALVEGRVTAGEAHAIPLSLEAVAALKKGGELRLFDANGREIPSLVHAAVSHGEVVDRPVEIFNRAWTEDGIQTLSVEVEGRLPQPVNEFVFEIVDEEFNASARVEGSEDGETWRILGDGLHLIRHTVKQQKIAYLHNVLRVPTARFRFYRFTLRPTRPGEPKAEPLEIENVAVREVIRRGSSLSLRVIPIRFDDPQDSDSRHHYWKLDLGRENLGIDRLEFSIPGKDFARSASLWEWSPERQRRTRRLATAVAFRYGKDAHTKFSGFATDARVLAMMIDQGDDDPVSVTAALARRPQQQLRFVLPRSASLPLALYFDPDEVRKPRYDLERRLREHEITSFELLQHTDLDENPRYAAAPEPRSERIPHLLYLLVVPLVLGLGWYVARTIQKGVPPEAPPPAA